MKQQLILKYCTSIIALFLFSLTVSAQEKTLIDSTLHQKKYGLRIGLDISKPIMAAFSDEFEGYELVADYRLSTKLYLAGEIGYINKQSREDTYKFSTDGSYTKLGVNWNLYNNWLDMDNELYVGGRYGFSVFDQDLTEYIVYQEGTSIEGISGSYFTPKTSTDPIHYNNLTAHWVELVIGIKVETFPNLFLGASGSYNTMISDVDPTNFNNLYVPGFGKVYSTNSGFTFNYTITYRIPFYKK